jgi:uncharacterized membrane protein
MQYVASIIGIEAIGDYSFTKYVQGERKNILYKILGYVAYITMTELFQFSIEKQGLIWTNTAWDGWSNIVTGLIALLVFKEKPTLKEFIGILLVSGGLVFLGTRPIASYNNGSKH